jgi:hypothetical protein
MATVRDRGAVATWGRGRPGEARPARLPVALADLITAIQDVVAPEDDRLVVTTGRHLLGAGRLTGLWASGTWPASAARRRRVIKRQPVRAEWVSPWA